MYGWPAANTPLTHGDTIHREHADLLYSALPIYRSHFSLNNSRKTPITRPLGRGMGVFRKFKTWLKFHLRSCCAGCNVVLYCTAIYRVYSISYGLKIHAISLRGMGHFHLHEFYCISGRNSNLSNAFEYQLPLCVISGQVFLGKPRVFWILILVNQIQESA